MYFSNKNKDTFFKNHFQSMNLLIQSQTTHTTLKMIIKNMNKFNRSTKHFLTCPNIIGAVRRPLWCLSTESMLVCTTSRSLSQKRLKVSTGSCSNFHFAYRRSSLLIISAVQHIYVCQMGRVKQYQQPSKQPQAISSDFRYVQYAVVVYVNFIWIKGLLLLLDVRLQYANQLLAFFHYDSISLVLRFNEPSDHYVADVEREET